MAKFLLWITDDTDRDCFQNNFQNNSTVMSFACEPNIHRSLYCELDGDHRSRWVEKVEEDDERRANLVVHDFGSIENLEASRCK